jgi:rare lipoprotein A (peptidoglycan hydrolase)
MAGRRSSGLSGYMALVALAAAVALALSCAPASAQVSDPSGRGKPTSDLGSYNQGPTVEVGVASWYGGKTVRGHKTASGELFNEEALTAAHPSLPFFSWVRVINLANGRSVVVKINDRNATYTGRVIDLTRKAADLLGLRSSGIGTVAIVPEPGGAPAHVAEEDPDAAALPRYGRHAS